MARKQEKPKKTFCVHCEEAVPTYECKKCGQVIMGCCEDCHKEIVHSEVKIQNVMTFDGSGWGHLEPRQREKFHA